MEKLGVLNNKGGHGIFLPRDGRAGGMAAVVLGTSCLGKAAVDLTMTSILWSWFSLFEAIPKMSPHSLPDSHQFSSVQFSSTCVAACIVHYCMLIFPTSLWLRRGIAPQSQMRKWRLRNAKGFAKVTQPLSGGVRVGIWS